MKNLLLLLLILPLTSCTDQELGWFILSPNNVEGLTNLKFLLSGLTTTIYISVISIIISAVIGFIAETFSLTINTYALCFFVFFAGLIRFANFKN